MKIAFVIFEGMTALDFIGAYDPLTRLKTMGFLPDLTWEICAFSNTVRDQSGLAFTPTRIGETLEGYDLLFVPGGLATRTLIHDAPFIEWLQTAAPIPLKTSVCTGALLLGAAGFLEGRSATTHPSAYEELRPYCSQVLEQRIVEDGDLITAGGVTSAIDLGLFLVKKLAGPETKEKIRNQIDYVSPAPAVSLIAEPSSAFGEPLQDGQRIAHIHRLTKETQITLDLNLDGRGRHEINTGLGFLDHLLTHLAVHGLFDLNLHVTGDLYVDAHHSVEDTALVLGLAFSQALGDRAGIIRMASAYAPMDETLAFVAVDFSGRPYAVVQADWSSPYIGNIPTTLFQHFLESFAVTARCNLHARILVGKDDHHKAEGLFKALARALDAATQKDMRRSGNVPSTKGTLVE